MDANNQMDFARLACALQFGTAMRGIGQWIVAKEQSVEHFQAAILERGFARLEGQFLVGLFAQQIRVDLLSRAGGHVWNCHIAAEHFRQRALLFHPRAIVFPQLTNCKLIYLFFVNINALIALKKQLLHLNKPIFTALDNTQPKMISFRLSMDWCLKENMDVDCKKELIEFHKNYWSIYLIHRLELIC